MVSGVYAYNVSSAVKKKISKTSGLFTFSKKFWFSFLEDSDQNLNSFKNTMKNIWT